MNLSLPAGLKPLLIYDFLLQAMAAMIIIIAACTAPINMVVDFLFDR
jgi:hypothetical protein